MPPFIDDYSRSFRNPPEATKLCEVLVEGRMQCGVPAEYTREGKPVCYTHNDPKRRVVFCKRVRTNGDHA